MTDGAGAVRTFGASTIELVAGDITRVPADAIVNAANDAFRNGGGVDGALRAAAGPELSGEMRRRYPNGTPTGTAVSTAAYALPATWVIHAVGPVWSFGGQDKIDLLASAYESALREADALGAKTVSMPASAPARSASRSTPPRTSRCGRSSATWKARRQSSG